MDIILSWKHKYKQTFQILSWFIETNSVQLIGVFPLMNTADNIDIPKFRVTLMDLAFILLFHQFQTIFDHIKTAICCDWSYLTNAIKTRTIPSDFD